MVNFYFSIMRYITGFFFSIWDFIRNPHYFFSPLYLFRELKLKATGQSVIISGGCNQCGVCCRGISLDIDGKWIKSEASFNKLVSNNAAYGRMKVIGRDSTGYLLFACSWLGEGNTCKDHENRLTICSSFPDKDLYSMGGKLPPGCGYKMVAGVPFNKVLEQKIKTKL